MKGFDDYTKEVEAFYRSKLYNDYYERFIALVSTRRIKCAELVSILNIPGNYPDAKIRKMAMCARRSGVLIDSNGHGYKLITDPIIIQGTIDHMEERIGSMRFTIEKLRESLHETNSCER